MELNEYQQKIEPIWDRVQKLADMAYRAVNPEAFSKAVWNNFNTGCQAGYCWLEAVSISIPPDDSEKAFKWIRVFELFLDSFLKHGEPSLIQPVRIFYNLWREERVEIERLLKEVE